jgi:hypothetical protein
LIDGKNVYIQLEITLRRLNEGVPVTIAEDVKAYYTNSGIKLEEYVVIAGLALLLIGSSAYSASLASMFIGFGIIEKISE